MIYILQRKVIDYAKRIQRRISRKRNGLPN
nr:MAG TPA: hypothetical protein [Caudoviricetes sp.]